AARAARAVVVAASLCIPPLLAGCTTDDIPSGGAVGEPAPAYAAPTLDGDTVSLESLRGRVVLVNVWATWCAPCRRETPDLQALYERHADDGLTILGVSVDAAGARRAIREFVREFDVTYPILHDSGERVANAFRVRGVPTSVLVDRDGMVVWRGLGPVHPDDDTFADALESALAGAVPSDESTASDAAGDR
ncbi:MAG: TlpA family protein disulfide reductase, partial [Gemmatimonadota bacterium]